MTKNQLTHLKVSGIKIFWLDKGNAFYKINLTMTNCNTNR